MEFLLPLIIGLVTSQIGGQGDTYKQTATTKQTALPRGYQSPMLGVMDSLMSSGLLGNLSRYNGAGMPGGAGNAGLGNLSSIMSMIMKMQPDLIAGAMEPAKKEEARRGSATRPH